MYEVMEHASGKAGLSCACTHYEHFTSIHIFLFKLALAKKPNFIVLIPSVISNLACHCQPLPP